MQEMMKQLTDVTNALVKAKNDITALESDKTKAEALVADLAMQRSNFQREVNERQSDLV